MLIQQIKTYQVKKTDYLGESGKFIAKILATLRGMTLIYLNTIKREPSYQLATWYLYCCITWLGCEADYASNFSPKFKNWLYYRPPEYIFMA
jgi:hypothetical protein